MKNKVLNETDTLGNDIRTVKMMIGFHESKYCDALSLKTLDRMRLYLNCLLMWWAWMVTAYWMINILSLVTIRSFQGIVHMEGGPCTTDFADPSGSYPFYPTWQSLQSELPAPPLLTQPPIFPIITVIAPPPPVMTGPAQTPDTRNECALDTLNNTRLWLC